jgi:hypothetical protein
MSKLRLSETQEKNRLLIRDLLKSLGEPPAKEEILGTKETYLTLSFKNYKLYLYFDGEANLHIYDQNKILKDIRYEHPDFNSESDLMSKVLSDIKGWLENPE